MNQWKATAMRIDRKKATKRQRTGIETEILRGKPSIKDVQKVKHVVYVNKDRTAILNKESLASENTNTNFTAVIQDQLQTISTQMVELNKKMNKSASDNKIRDERLHKIEQNIIATEAQVRKPNNKLNKDDLFDATDIYNSIAITPELNKVSLNDISNIVKDEIKKLNLSSNNNDSISTDVTRQLRNTIRAEFNTKDPNMKRAYRLMEQTKFEHFMDFLKSELRTLDLMYVIDLKQKRQLSLMM